MEAKGYPSNYRVGIDGQTFVRDTLDAFQMLIYFDESGIDNERIEVLQILISRSSWRLFSSSEVVVQLKN